MNKTENKLLAVIPFCGFYESHASYMIDRVVESLFDYKGSGSPEIPDEFWLHYRSSAIDLAFAQAYLEAFNDKLNEELEINVKLAFESLQSPKYYNFETDRIFAYISFEDLETLRGAIDEKALRNACRDHLTSRDGFISSYDSDPDEWGPLAEWDYNQVSMLFHAAIEHQIEMPPVYELLEDWEGNGGLSDAVYEGLPEECLVMADEYYKKASS